MKFNSDKKKASDTPTGNIPANDSWYLSFGYTLENDVVEKFIDIAYLPNGSIDFTRTSTDDFTKANNLLQPIVSFVQTHNSSEFDIWKVLNGLFVGYYWFVLADLGQTSPTTYPNSGQFLVPSNFSQPIFYPSANNIILNTDLSRTVFSNIGSNGSDETASVLHAVTGSNRSVEANPRIRRIYLCTVRQRKPFISLVVSIFGVGFSLIATFYSCGLLGLQMIDREEKKVIEDGANEEEGMKLMKL